MSGLALGIDAAAHAGALEADGATVAVMAGGLADVYPQANRALAERMLEKGAWISEFPIDMTPRPQFFPYRNRVISGLSRLVLVVEAQEASGALITAGTALEQGREVFAVPGNSDIRSALGSNRLIKDGASVALDASDILSALGLKSGPAALAQQNTADGLTPTDTDILQYLNDERIAFEQILQQCGMPSGDAACALLRLQSKGFVKQWPGQYYSRIKFDE